MGPSSPFGPGGPSGLTLAPCLQRSQISYKCHLVLRPIPELLRAPPERVWVAVPRRPPPSGGLSSSSDSEEEELEELKDQLEELKRPPKLSARELQALLKEKVDSGQLTEDEAYQLGWKG